MSSEIKESEIVFTNQKAFFATGETLSVPLRKKQLRRLKEVLQQNERLLYEAIYADFGKSEFDTYTTELALIYQDIDYALSHLVSWSRPQRVSSNWINFPSKSYIVKEPLGACLVIGAWNYPYQLSLAPTIAAISAGCTVVIKPSELPAATSSIMAKLINENFDAGFLHVLQGGIPETTELLDLKWSKIFFSGSVTVGKKVYQAAAKNLVPVTLELGGKSPAIIAKDCNLKITVKRLVWAKFLNAGQTCIVPDYALVDSSIAEEFVIALKNEIKNENFSLSNSNYAQIINTDNLERLSNLIKASNVAYGGEVDRDSRVIQPTIVYPADFESAIMQEEIFGPILPVLVYDDIDDAITMVAKGEKPLSSYLFTESSAVKNKFLTGISFGGGAVNDAIMHVSNNKLPFGGIGNSGIGSYRGRRGFECFTHNKSILDKSTLFELNLKYFPHTQRKLYWVKRILKLS